ncbi:amidase [Gemmatimonas sp. UBA7669]|uniref:amidase n=1 Tax=Gemmatimonas sp. UBA7669 TaxID=1946568 RepID=UPI0025BBF0B8|nr:amidase [Gemmatimonas sp. UBA7669]
MSCSRREALAALGALLATPSLSAALAHAEDTQPADMLLATSPAFQAARIRGELTAEQVVRRALDRCNTLGTSWRAIDLLSSSALADARASDERLRRGRLLGALDGVPVFAKSIYDLQGQPTSASSAEWVRLFPDAVPRDAVEVARLRAAGAVVLGKTAADDFAYRGNGTSSHTGQVLNPYDASAQRTPGGSSAGAAVVVAGGMAFSALGTDDGGSNRIPAQFTGVVGMKPSFGLVPRSGVIPTWPYLDTHGPLARSVMDAALMLWALVGADGEDALSHDLGRDTMRAMVTTSGVNRTAVQPSFTPDALRGRRLGIVSIHAPRTQMSAESVAQFDKALADCRTAGAIVDVFDAPVTRVNVRERFAEVASARGNVRPNPNSPAATANALYRYFARQGVDARAAAQRGHAAYRAFYDVLPTDWPAFEALLTSPYEHDAAGVSFARSREQVVTQLASAMRAERIDALVYPTMPFPAPLAVNPWPDVRTPLGFGNWMGLPEVSVPAGYDSQGMPLGNLSFVGLPGDDAALLAMAYAYEQQSRHFKPPAAVGSR